MIKAKRLVNGDKIAIVSLSKGTLGESFVAHNLEIGMRRLREFGLEPVLMPHALKGIEFVEAHPEKRAEDLIEAFREDSIKGIICAIGGNDTYKTLPYLMENQEFLELVKTKPKLFTGFSDTTVNHLMFYKLGLTTYYGMALIPDLGEIDHHMLPYTQAYFSYYLAESKSYQIIEPSELWYDERLDFSAEAIGKARISHVETKGYELLQGSSCFEGALLGGCLESLVDMLDPTTHEDEPGIVEQYQVFPSKAEWENKILFIETSEEKTAPENYREMLMLLKEQGIFDVASGVIVGKPENEIYYEEYKQELIEVADNKQLPIVYNVNFGHATPRCVLPLGIKVRIDTKKQQIEFLENPFLD